MRIKMNKKTQFKHFLNKKLGSDNLKIDLEIKEIELTLLSNQIKELREQSNINLKLNK